MNRIIVAICIVLVLALGAVFVLRGDSGIFGSRDSHAGSNPDSEKVLTKTLSKEELESKRVKLLRQQIGENFQGSVDAPVLMIEYASLSCGACGHFHNNVLPKLKEKYVKNGKMRFVYRHYPLNAQALSAAKLTNCINPKSFFGYVKILFKSQKYWAYSEDFKDRLKQIAKRGGFSEQEFNACMANKDLEDMILKEQLESAQILGVTATPTIFINGVQYEGDKDVDEISEFIEARLKGEDSKI